MPKPSRRSWIALALTAGLVASLGGAVGASADTAVTHSGAYGVHYLADSSEYAGVRCTYNNSNVINSIRVRDPLTFARNKTAGVDTQWVSWYFRVQKQTPGSTGWTDVATSATQKRTATDGQIANFSPITRVLRGQRGLPIQGARGDPLVRCRRCDDRRPYDPPRRLVFVGRCSELQGPVPGRDLLIDPSLPVDAGNPIHWIASSPFAISL